MSISTRFGALVLASLCSLLTAAPSLRAHVVVWPSGHVVVAGEGEEEGATGEAALNEARAVKQAAYELEAGEARSAALLAAAEAYSRVSQNERFELAARVEAAYRAGELLRTHGSTELAVERFARCVRLGEAAHVEEQPKLREFAARALLEQAHVQRRGKRFAEAAAGYAEVSARFAEVSRRAAQARGWQLRMLLEQEQLDAAVSLGGELVKHLDDDPLESVQGVDRLGAVLVEAGQEPEAQALVERLQQALSPHLEGEGAAVERLRLALQELRVTVRLSVS
ncbi:MAG: hypothetical protein DHS20C15_33170 [Planctomycetota bacterium]|nr:MAG: hypothetical protein DHS20C15_33170 [Planctomycetota bacterium]